MQVSTKRTGINIVSQWMLHITNVAVNCFLIGYVIYKVGDENYGGWASIASIIGYLFLLNSGLSNAIQYLIARFSVNKQNEEMSSVFSAAYVVYGIGACIALFICLIVSKYYTVIFTKIPAQAAAECVTALKWVAPAMMANLLTMPIQGTILGLQSHYVWNIIEVTSLLARACVVICSFIYIDPSLSYLGAGYLAAAMTRLILGRLALLRLAPTIRFHFSLINRESLRNIFSFGGHSALWTICAVINRESAPIIAAIYLNAKSATYLYIGVRLVQAIGTFITNGSVVFVPMTSQLKANNDKERLRSALIRGSRFCVLLALSGAAVIFIFGRSVILHWVGIGDKQCYYVVVILTFSWMGYWMFSVAHAMLVGLRVLGPITGIMLFRAIFSLAIGLILAKYYGILGLVAGIELPRFLSATLIVPYLACHRMNISIRKYLGKILPTPFLIGIILSLVSLAIHYIWISTSVWVFLAQGIIVFIVFSVLALWKGLDGMSRRLIIDKIKMVLIQNRVKQLSK